MPLQQTLTPKSSLPQIDARASAINALCEAGGPEPEQYPELLARFTQIHAMHGAGEIGDDDITTLRNAFGPAIGIGTLQGRACPTTGSDRGSLRDHDLTLSVLRYRSADQLETLAKAAGSQFATIRVENEPLGVNLFIVCRSHA